MEIKRIIASNLKSRLLIAFGVATTLSTVAITLFNVLFFPTLVSAQNGIRNSSTLEEYAYRIAFIIIGIICVITFLVSSVSTYGVWKAYTRIKKADTLSWFQKISLVVAALLCLLTIIVSFKLLV